MPISLELRPLYPPNWRELANWIKFERAGGRCEWCGREHGTTVLVIASGGWLDPETGECHDEQGRSLGFYAQAEWPKGRSRENDPDLRSSGPESHPQRPDESGRVVPALSLTA